MNKFDYVDAEWTLGIALAQQSRFILVIKTVAIEVSNLGLSTVLGTSDVLGHGIDEAADIAEEFGQDKLE